MMVSIWVWAGAGRQQ